MKRIKITNSKRFLLLGLISVLLIGFAVVNIKTLKAQFSFMDKVAKITGEQLAERLFGEMSGQFGQTEEVIEEEVFGRVLPEAWTRQGELTTWTMGGSFRDVSTTIVSFINPYGSPTSTDEAYNERNWFAVKKNATSTIDLGMLNITGAATTSYAIQCGASVDAYADPTYTFIRTNDVGIATGTTALVMNNASTTGTTSGLAVINGSNQQKIVLTKDYSWFVCKVLTPNTIYNGAFTDPATNTFDGKWSFRVMLNP